MANPTFGFGSGIFWGTALVDANGNSVAAPTPQRLGVVQDMSLDFDLATKELYGTYQFALAVGRGTGKIAAKIKFAQVNMGVWNSLYYGETAQPNKGGANQIVIVNDEAAQVVAAVVVGGVTAAITTATTALTLSGTITGLTVGMVLSIAGAGPAGAALVVTLVSGATTSWVVSVAAGTTVTTAAVTTFPSYTVANSASTSTANPLTDLGVRWGAGSANAGLVFTKVSGVAPTTGQYIHDLSGLGVYTFAAVDNNPLTVIDYGYAPNASTNQSILITNHLLGNAPSFQSWMKVRYGTNQVSIQLNNCVSSKLNIPTKLDGFLINEFDFACFADGAGNIGIITGPQL